MNIIVLVSTALIGAILSITVKQYRPEYAVVISIVTGVIILITAIISAGSIIDEISLLSESAGLDNIYITVLLKALAVCYLTQMACDCCRDSGESAIASKLEIAGKIAVLIISLPMFRELTEIITGLIEI